METSKKSTGKKLKGQTSSAEVTRVSLSVRQVSGEVKKIRGICGHGSEQPLASYDQDTQSWKMFGDISLWGDSPLLENLPVSGMTQSGVLFLQHPWEPITAETASLSWPTPVASDAWTTDLASSQVKEGSMHSVSLGRAVQIWPTPTVDDASNVNPKPNRFRGLVAAVNETFPTPTASDWKGRGPNSKQQGLPEVIKKGTPNGNGGKLNPTWVEWLMGFPEGWTDLED
jgi:DNA (cytosine-5)-methyltransferase 1